MTNEQKNGLRIWGNTISTVALVVVLLTGFTGIIWSLATTKADIKAFRYEVRQSNREIRTYIDHKTAGRWSIYDDYNQTVRLCNLNNLKMPKHERASE